VTVVDASVVVQALADDTLVGDHAREALLGQALTSPEVLDLEVLAALRGLNRANLIDRARADAAIADLTVLPVRRLSHVPLVRRIWQLRDNVTAYDGAYVALAETLEVPLLTRDVRLSRATGIRCEVELLR